jgi:quinolinate synthase
MLVTECSMSDNVQADNPNVEFIKPCNLCPYMKKINLQKILIVWKMKQMRFSLKRKWRKLLDNLYKE